MCKLSINLGLLPHSNPGILEKSEFKKLKPYNASMGLMLETLADIKGHEGCAGKNPGSRIKTIEYAGELKIPFTTGILVGIGETWEERVRSIHKIKELHEEFGHIQEVIIQNFIPKPGTKMASCDAPGLDEMIRTVRMARELLPSEITIQVPPNLIPPRDLVKCGAGDLGGISPETIDYINPEAPWPNYLELQAMVDVPLRERLPIYPGYVKKGWYSGGSRIYWAVFLTQKDFGKLISRYLIKTANSGGNIQKLQTKQELRKICDDSTQRIEAGNSTIDDAFTLLNYPDILFSLADMLRKKVSGDSVTYVINRNINFTNKCIGTCKFCAFKKQEGYIMSIPEILEKTRTAVRINATEVCIQGGLLPNWDVFDYCSILENIKTEFPNIHIHAFSPMEVYHASQNSNMSYKETLSNLKRSGLGSMPGTAAEILVDRVREEICPDKLTAHEWIDVIKTAHYSGIPTTATIMYGHIETLRERIEHIMLIRDIQKKTGGFTEFVPLPFMSSNNTLGMGKNVSRGIEDLKLHALARVLLYPYVKNIQASWVKLGRELAQSALTCGANDLGGTLMEEQISKSAGATNGEYMAPFEFESMIRQMNRIPQQRDTLYRHLNVA